MGAKYPLRDVQAAARDKRVELDEPRARDTVLLFFDTLLDCYPFACAVLLALRPEDWRKTVSLTEPPHPGQYDEYGVVLSQEVADRFGVEREWYLKLRLREDWSGDTVFMVSLHRPDRPLGKKAGKS